jgi:hypothetical protein
MLGDPVVAGMVGYLAASLAAGLTMAVDATLMEMWVRRSVARPDVGPILGAAAILSFAVAAVAWAPATGLMIYGARARVRSILYYVGSGLFSGAFVFCVGYAIGLFGESDQGFLPVPPLTTAELMQLMVVMFLLPGISAGLTYWVIAGRRNVHSAD